MVTNISTVSGLKPKSKYFEEVGDTCINVDGCIEICRQTDTPEAKRIYKAFRKRLALLNRPDLTAEKQREEAFFQALELVGVRTSFTKIKGTME